MYQFFVVIFYLGIIPLMLHELFVYQDAENVLEKIKKIKNEGTLEGTGTILLAVSELFYFIWNIIGLCSSQGIAWVFILILSLIPKRNVIWIKMDSVICMTILVFILLNKFQFHIDLNKVLFSIL